MNPAFWKNKTVFITGHTGFKGSWLSLWLQQLGAKVTGYALNAPTIPSLFELAQVSENMVSIIGDIRNEELLSEAIQKARPEIVIHMAAQALVRESYTSPIDTFKTNIIGTASLLEAVRKSHTVKACVNVTTDKCYENKEWEWGYRENEPMGGHDPYSSSKACSEIISSSYRRSFLQEMGIGLATARAGNVIGGGDWATDRLLPDIFKAWLEEQKVVIRSPHSIRPWQFVLEPLAGYLTLAEKLWDNPDKYSEAWNFGPSDEDAQPVGQIVREIECQLENFNCEVNEDSKLHEAKYLKLDCSKARLKLGWRPQINLSKALNWTVDWYRQYKENGNIRKITLDQISNFQRIGEK